MDNKKVMIVGIVAVVAVVIAVVFGAPALINDDPGSGANGDLVPVTVDSNPAGSGQIKVDGTVVVTPASFDWEKDSTHTLEALSSDDNSADMKYSWVSWSDGGAQTHDYTVNEEATVTATFDAQYKVEVAQTGLDSSANENIVTVQIGSDNSQVYSLASLPVSAWVTPGTQVTYSFEGNVSTTVPDAYFMLSNTHTEETLTINEPQTVTGAYTRAIIDAKGNIINVPDPSDINRIADSWPAHNTVVVMCGAKEKLVATATINTVNPMFQKILPQIETMLTPFNSDGTVNIEELMVQDPDIVFVSASGEDAAAAMESSGLTVIRLQFYDFDDMVHTVHLTGWILGEEALDKAVTFIDYFNGVRDNILTVTSHIAEEDKPVVLHITGTADSPLRIDAGEGLINTWINLCGGINAAAEVGGNMQTVSLEQILAWDPEMILIGQATANEMKDDLLHDESWSEVTAIQNGDVIANPMGVFDWARYSVEEALNIQWVSQTLHPDLFADIDIRAETQYFYSTFYDYNLTEAEIDSILR
ncbi:MAG: ABC transporter substrate-binding protein [Candidatus Bathyarchaeota archaeon]|nr:ABC transporter substrate-binding protein [Candidatus Bathyarchaeota archaeon]